MSQSQSITKTTVLSNRKSEFGFLTLDEQIVDIAHGTLDAAAQFPGARFGAAVPGRDAEVELVWHRVVADAIAVGHHGSEVQHRVELGRHLQ